ncbi:unnamed protein product, partial [Dicrocoelium dendriticum]
MEDADKISWDRAYDIAHAKVEISEQSPIFLSTISSTDIDRLNSSPSTTISLSGSECYRCGKAEYRANIQVCPARNSMCRNCGKPGRFARVCRSRTISRVHPSTSNLS